MNRNLDGLMTKSGMAWRRQRVAIAAGIGAVLLDDLPVSEQTGDRAS